MATGVRQPSDTALRRHLRVGLGFVVLIASQAVFFLWNSEWRRVVVVFGAFTASVLLHSLRRANQRAKRR